MAKVFNLETLRQNKSNFFSRITKDNEQADPLVVLLSEKYIKLEPNKLHIVNCSPASPESHRGTFLNELLSSKGKTFVANINHVSLIRYLKDSP